MKKSIIFILILLCSNVIYSETLSEYLNYKSNFHYFMNVSGEEVFFTEDKKTVEFNVHVDKKNNNFLKKKYTYDIINENNFAYLVVSNKNEVKEYLMLVDEFYLFLYDLSNLNPFFIGEIQEDKIPTESLDVNPVNNVIATSFLVESVTSYLPENISNFNLNSPWVEGVDGYGIGETITFNCSKSRGMIISLGYVSFEKPYLYTKNSRPKKIKVTLVNSDKSCLIDLKDTPNPQFFEYPEQLQYEGEVKLEILDVYKGTSWDDTCINFIQPIYFMPSHCY